MKLNRLGPNQTVVTYSDGTAVLYSYSTPVAAHVPGRGYLRTNEHYSVTTSRHINAWVGGASAGTKVEQKELDEIIGRREA